MLVWRFFVLRRCSNPTHTLLSRPFGFLQRNFFPFLRRINLIIKYFIPIILFHSSFHSAKAKKKFTPISYLDLVNNLWFRSLCFLTVKSVNPLLKTFDHLPIIHQPSQLLTSLSHSLNIRVYHTLHVIICY